MKKKALIIFNLLLVALLNAQTNAPGLAWKKTFGGKKSEVAYDVIPTNDGQIVIVGTSTSAPAKKMDGIWLLLDQNGNKITQQYFGKEKEDVIKSVIQTYDGHFVLAGYTTLDKDKGRKQGWLF